MDGNHSLVATLPIICQDMLPHLIISVLFGLPANMFVIWLILAGPGDKAAEIFSLNLAVCEVAICTSDVILFITRTITVSNGVHSTYFTYIVKFTMGFLYAGRPLFMSSVCVERYLAIVHPVTFLKYKRLSYRLAGTIICWLKVLVCCIIMLCVPYPAVYYVSFSTALSWFPVQLFCCAEALRALCQPGPGERNQARRNRMKGVKLKAFRIILGVTVFAALTYLPYVISSIFSCYSFELETSSILFCISSYFALVSAFISPFCYIHRAAKLQHCVKDAA